MPIKSEVNIDFANAEITWGVADGLPATSSTLDIRGLKITVRLLGAARDKKGYIVGILRRSLKPFVQDGQLKPSIHFNGQIKLFLVSYCEGNIAQWKDNHLWADVGEGYTYGLWFNLEAPSEMLIRDAEHATSLESDSNTMRLNGYPGCIEFVKSEGGVLFIPHRLGLDSLTDQAVVMQRVRRELWRRTRNGGHFSDYGNVELRPSASPGIHDLWLGENHIWSIDETIPYDVTPNLDYFTEWGLDYVLENRIARKRIAEFTFNQLT